MRIAIVHGYFLSDSGSAIYVRELARELKRQRHEVTLVCQERKPEQFEFIDAVYDLDESNLKLQPVFERDGVVGEDRGGHPGVRGYCRLVRPDTDGRLLTYVAGPLPGFDALPYQDASEQLIHDYTRANITALRTIFSKWPQDLVLANHMVMQPYMVSEAITDGTPYVVTIHGSALNFTVRADERMVPYARAGLEGASAVASLSSSSRNEVIDFGGEVGLEIESKCLVLPPGVDTSVFSPVSDTDATLSEISDQIDPDGDTILFFVGRLLWTKGLQYAVAALPLVIQKIPQARLLVAGDGPMRGELDKLIGCLDDGDLQGAENLLLEAEHLRPSDDYGPVLPPMGEGERSSYAKAAKGNLRNRIHFIGHVSHGRLAPLYAAADLTLAPSVFPEAFGLVCAEAIAAGAVPIATYQSGLRDPLDAVASHLSEPILKRLVPGVPLTMDLAELIVDLLERFRTRDAEFRRRLHALADEQFSWAALAGGYLELKV